MGYLTHKDPASDRYATVPQIIAEWKQYREQEAKSAMEAARGKANS